MTRLLSVKELAPILGVKPPRVYELYKENKIPGAVVLGANQIRFSEKIISEWISGGESRKDAKVQTA